MQNSQSQSPQPDRPIRPVRQKESHHWIWIFALALVLILGVIAYLAAIGWFDALFGKNGFGG